MQYKLSYKRKLPHFQPRKGIFFVTLRLAFDIPDKYLLTLNNYREVLNARFANDRESPETKEYIKKKMFDCEDQLLPSCTSDISLTKSPIAQILQGRLLKGHEHQYYLFASTIMPNHIHLLVRPLSIEGSPVSIGKLIKDFKGSTARLINLELNRKGRLWFPEYFDHWIRNQREFVNVIEYIRNNPVKAGLAKNADSWQWTWLNPDLWSELV